MLKTKAEVARRELERHAEGTILYHECSGLVFGYEFAAAWIDVLLAREPEKTSEPAWIVETEQQTSIFGTKWSKRERADAPAEPPRLPARE
jgi:hypothetical protein